MDAIQCGYKTVSSLRQSQKLLLLLLLKLLLLGELLVPVL